MQHIQYNIKKSENQIKKKKIDVPKVNYVFSYLTYANISLR